MHWVWRGTIAVVAGMAWVWLSHPAFGPERINIALADDREDKNAEAVEAM